jgi:hypothetical protein
MAAVFPAPARAHWLRLSLPIVSVDGNMDSDQPKTDDAQSVASCEEAEVVVDHGIQAGFVGDHHLWTHLYWGSLSSHLRQIAPPLEEELAECTPGKPNAAQLSICSALHLADQRHSSE